MGLAMVRAGQVAKLSEASALQLLVDPAARQRIDGLTAFDRAFLSTLYSGDPGAPAEARAAQIAARAVGRLPMPHGAERVVR
jgi:hypothetical protein